MNEEIILINNLLINGNITKDSFTAYYGNMIRNVHNNVYTTKEEIIICCDFALYGMLLDFIGEQERLSSEQDNNTALILQSKGYFLSLNNLKNISEKLNYNSLINSKQAESIIFRIFIHSCLFVKKETTDNAISYNLNNDLDILLQFKEDWVNYICNIIENELNKIGLLPPFFGEKFITLIDVLLKTNCIKIKDVFKRNFQKCHLNNLANELISDPEYIANGFKGINYILSPNYIDTYYNLGCGTPTNTYCCYCQHNSFCLEYQNKIVFVSNLKSGEIECEITINNESKIEKVIINDYFGTIDYNYINNYNNIVTVKIENTILRFEKNTIKLMGDE